MAEILLVSEKYIKDVTNISDNLQGKYLQSSLYEAQEINLRTIIGGALLDKCKALIKDGGLDLAENAKYKEVVERSRRFVAYTAICDICVKSSYKVTNFGIAKANDENLQLASWEEISRNRSFYQNKADSWCYQLQQWLLERRAEYPELTTEDEARFHSNLYSAASGGLWLGGYRGRR